MLRVPESPAWVALSCASLRSLPASTVLAGKARFQHGRAFAVSRGWSMAERGGKALMWSHTLPLPRGAAWSAWEVEAERPEGFPDTLPAQDMG